MSPDSAPPPMPPTPPPFMPSVPPPFMPPTPPPMQSEVVRLVVEKVNQKTGMFSKQTYRMLVTDTRLIFALQEKNNVDYMRQDPNQTLAENPANFAIPLDQLQVIEVYHSTFNDNNPDSMVVKTFSDKMTFNIYDALRIGQNLKKVLGNKVK